jgi:hypothetical protein
MGKLTAKQVIAYSKADSKKYSDGEGLYFCVRKQGSPYWMIRYTTAKGRREATFEPPRVSRRLFCLSQAANDMVA